MSKKDNPIKNNPVAKHAPEFCKPKTFRDRKKQPSNKEELRNHPLHEPYVRTKSVENYLLEENEWSEFEDEDEEDECDMYPYADATEEEYPREPTE